MPAARVTDGSCVLLVRYGTKRCRVPPYSNLVLGFLLVPVVSVLTRARIAPILRATPDRSPACAPPPPLDDSRPSHLPMDLPDAFLAWLQARHRLSPRHLDLIRGRARLMVPKEIAVELALEVSTVRRLQALTLRRLRIRGGERGLLLWLADAYARWEADGGRGAA